MISDEGKEIDIQKAFESVSRKSLVEKLQSSSMIARRFVILALAGPSSTFRAH